MSNCTVIEIDKPMPGPGLKTLIAQHQDRH